MSLIPRSWSAGGLLAATVAALVLTQRGAPVLDFLPGEGLVPAVLVVVGAAVAAYGLVQANPGPALAGAGVIVVGTALVRLGLPNPLEWGLALVGAVGLVLFLEPLLVADRALQLRDRLEEAGEAGAGTDPDRLAERTVSLRMSQVRKTLVLSAALVAGAILAGVVLRAVLPAAVGASLELDSLYGATLWTLLAVAGVVAAQVLLTDGETGDDA